MKMSTAYAQRVLAHLRGKLNSNGSSERLEECLQPNTAWLGNEGIVGTSVGYRVTGGRRFDDVVIRVHVRTKKNGDSSRCLPVPAAIRVPGFARAIAVDVVESMSVTLHAGCGDGIACQGASDFGTLGLGVTSSSENLVGDIFILTCGHAISGNIGDDILDIGFPAATNGAGYSIGTLAYKSELAPATAADAFPNIYEIALINASSPIDPSMQTVPAPNGFRASQIQLGERVRFVGAVSGESSGTVIALNRTETVDIENALWGFSQLVEYDAPSHPGDSGAAVMDSTGRVVGMHFGMDNGTRNSLYVPIGPVVRRYKLALTKVDRKEGELAAPSMEPAVSARGEAIDALARTIWGEARNQPTEGMVAIANVVLNRVRARRLSFGKTIEQVCRKPKQFSCWNSGDRNLPLMLAVSVSDRTFSQCLDIARAAVNGTLADNTNGSTHYHARTVSASWSVGHTPAAEIGDHLFYNDIS